MFVRSAGGARPALPRTGQPRLAGSTVGFVLERLAERIKSGELSGISAVPTADKTEAELHRLGIPCLKARHFLDAF